MILSWDKNPFDIEKVQLLVQPELSEHYNVYTYEFFF